MKNVSMYKKERMKNSIATVNESWEKIAALSHPSSFDSNSLLKDGAYLESMENNFSSKFV